MVIQKYELLQALKNNNISPAGLEQYSFEVMQVKGVRRVFQLKTNQGLKALKIYTYSVDELLFMSSVMEHLQEHNFQNYAQICLNKQGYPYVHLGKESYLVTAWVTGREADYSSERDVQATVKTLANFHRCSKGFKPGTGIQIRNRLGKWPENFKLRTDQLVEFMWEAKGKKTKSKFDRIFLRTVEQFYEEACYAQKILAETAYPELVETALRNGCFCHHDMAHHNVIIKNGQGFLIDFDYCIADMRCHDLASLIIRAMKKNNWAFGKAEKIIDIYHKHFPLLQKEIGVMLAFMLFPQDFWQVAWTYYREDIGRTEKESISRLQRVIRMNKYRHEFLDSFAELT